MEARTLSALLLTFSAACSAEDVTTESELSSCEPLAAETSAIELGTLIGAGQADDGTVYAIDKSGTELRGFISEGRELYRQRVSGTGEVSDAAGHTTTVTLDERTPPLTLEVVVAADGTTRMGVAEGILKTKTFAIGEEGEELTLLGVDDVVGLPLHNDPGEVVIEYVAEVEGEELLVVLRPRDLTGYEQFRVFFGTPERLEECAVQSVTRAKDGGSTRIEFSVDGEEAVASFPIEFIDEQFIPGAPSLTLDGEGLEISLSDSSAQADAGYFCRAPLR